MGLGQKLQSAYNKVNTKLGTQDGTIVFRKKTVVSNSTFGKPYTSSANSDVSISAGIKIGRMTAFEVSNSSVFKMDDLKLIIPGGLVTEAQLTNAEVVYNSNSYTIVSKSPLEIYSGVVVNWLVIARLKA